MGITRRPEISLTCEICGTEYLQQVRVYRQAVWKNRCLIHRRRIEKPNACIGCRVSIHPTSKRCKTCSNKSRRRRFPRKCIDCRRQIGARSLRCLSCHNASQDKGFSRERTKFANSKRWRALRVLCFQRDNYTCQDCGDRNRRGRGGTVELHPHHLLPWADFPEYRLELWNLVTLCADCHRDIHWGKKEEVQNAAA